jgi:hypothetical protein
LGCSFDAPRFVSDEVSLAEVLHGIKLWACPHCRETGTLIGHGFLRGYAERGSGLVVRGRRIFCSNRGRRPGCGRTFSVKLQTVVSGFVVSTVTLWCFVQAVLGGLTLRAAWLVEAAGTLSLSSGYRLWRRLGAAQSALRARLCREAPAPPSNARDPLAQLCTHLQLVIGGGVADFFSAYQSRFGRGLFDS